MKTAIEGMEGPRAFPAQASATEGERERDEDLKTSRLVLKTFLANRG